MLTCGIPMTHTMTKAAYTYLDEWGIPSGGDWALHRGGAVFIENAVEIKVDETTFTMLDGNALFLSGYVRVTSLLPSLIHFV